MAPFRVVPDRIWPQAMPDATMRTAIVERPAPSSVAPGGAAGLGFPVGGMGDGGAC